MRKRTLLFCLSFLLILKIPAVAGSPQESLSGIDGEIGIDEKLGVTVPLDLAFRDETGATLALKDLIRKPVILSLVYYTCPNMCPRILSSLARTLGRLSMDPGKDFSVITVSFDERDTPERASRKKKNYLKAIGRPFPPEAWRFLTGDLDSIRKLTGAVGFHFTRRGDAFEHPAALIILSPGGKVIRYLYGLEYLPFDVKMALTEASEGRIGATVRRTLLFCFSYDPEGKTYVFQVLKVTGTVILFLAGIFLIFLLIRGRAGSSK